MWHEVADELLLLDRVRTLWVEEKYISGGKSVYMGVFAVLPDNRDERWRGVTDDQRSLA